MLKEKAVASMGQLSLLLPAWISAALQANDRLKLYLSMLQSAVRHARTPKEPYGDWRGELIRAGVQDAVWLRDLVKAAYFDDGVLIIPQHAQLLDALADDLAIMSRPVCDGDASANSVLVIRRDNWLRRLHIIGEEEGISQAALADLTSGDHKNGDSFHVLVMDLHKQINGMAAHMATEDIDGAHVWQIMDEDRVFISAFMRGLHRTSPLKFSHPGLDTAVTRDGTRLLIQNDIGTNDAHVLVVEIENCNVRITYSDLHPERFDFFRHMLEEVGYQWKVVDPVTTEGLNAGKPYTMGCASLKGNNDEAVSQALESLASRIVFVIDWNRARKRLQNFVRKGQAMSILQNSARAEWGHMAWLLAGGERLVFDTMQAVDSEAFRIGDRLDDVLGEAAAVQFLLELMRISSRILLQQQPVALVADEARMLLSRVLRQRTFEFDLLSEHAAYCHALAQALSDAIESGTGVEASTQAEVVVRAKMWERRADHLLMDARQRAERHRRWVPIVDLLEKSDDVADALEEAIFIHSLILGEPISGLPQPVTEVLGQLAAMTHSSIQDLVKVIEVARHITERGDPGDNEFFLQTIWRILRAERLCDDLLRRARRSILQSLHTMPAAFSLANDLAATIEKASDGLLVVGYSLRKIVFAKTGMNA